MPGECQILYLKITMRSVMMLFFCLATCFSTFFCSVHGMGLIGFATLKRLEEKKNTYGQDCIFIYERFDLRRRTYRMIHSPLLDFLLHSRCEKKTNPMQGFSCWRLLLPKLHSTKKKFKMWPYIYSFLSLLFFAKPSLKVYDRLETKGCGGLEEMMWNRRNRVAKNQNID